MNNSDKEIYKYIEKNVNIEFEAVESRCIDCNYESKFRSSFYSLFSFIENGQLESIIRLKDKDIKIERKGPVACYVPREVHVKTNLLESSEVNIILSRMNFNIFGNLDLLSFFDVPFILDFESSKKIKLINHQLYNLDFKKDSEIIRSIVTRKSLCFQILELILAISPFKREGFKKLIAIEEFFPVINYINKNYKQKISNKTLAELMHLSLSRFCHKFKLSMGVTPQRYILQQRFLKITKLLASTNLRISEIASDYGFSDQFHFSCAFKSAIGYSPQQYRNLLRNNKETLFPS